MQQLILYTTLGCHLCEQAKNVIWPVITGTDIRLIEVDIADDPELVESYGVRIPVIKLKGQDAELGWPFDEPAVAAFLSL